MRLKWGLMALGLMAAAATPSQANRILDNATLRAACGTYTMTFQGREFLLNETATITWTITLNQGGTDFPIVDSYTYTNTDGNPNPVITVTRPWNMTLTGTYSVLNCDGVGFYSWSSSTGASSASAWQLIDPASGSNLPPPSFPCANATLTCPNSSVVEVCRKPRFWGRHAGTEGCRTQNVTQQVLAKVSFVNICGVTIDRTNLNSAFSAEEALCVKGNTTDRLRLARQLTGTALNCIMSGGGANCTGVSIGSTFTDCNNACAANNDAAKIASCISSLNCWNRGGVTLSNGMCKIGTCNGDGVTPCSSDASCPGPASDPDDKSDCDKDDDDDDDTGGLCVRTTNNCADQPLVNAGLGLSFHPAGAPGSAKACKEAKKNSCTIFSCPSK